MECIGVHAAQDVHTSIYHIDTCKTSETKQAEKGIGIYNQLVAVCPLGLPCLGNSLATQQLAPNPFEWCSLQLKASTQHTQPAKGSGQRGSTWMMTSPQYNCRSASSCLPSTDNSGKGSCTHSGEVVYSSAQKKMASLRITGLQKYWMPPLPHSSHTPVASTPG